MMDLTEESTPLEGGLSSNQSSFQTSRHRRHSDPKAPDLLGNLPLHHAFAHNPDTEKIRGLLREYPHGASIPNQFGRLPLHYAVDRSKVNVDAIRLLVTAYPQGANTKAADGVTPYDIAVGWGLGRDVLRLLLEADPEQDRAALQMLKFGVLASVYFWFTRPRHAPISVAREGQSFHSNEVHELGSQGLQGRQGQNNLEAVEEAHEHDPDNDNEAERGRLSGRALSSSAVVVDKEVYGGSRSATPSGGSGKR